LFLIFLASAWLSGLSARKKKEEFSRAEDAGDAEKRVCLKRFVFDFSYLSVAQRFQREEKERRVFRAEGAGDAERVPWEKRKSRRLLWNIKKNQLLLTGRQSWPT
jgi:hypothetical protein